MEKKTLIIGPSHIVRWLHFLDTELLPDIRKNITFHGKGGSPVWCDFIKNERKNFKKYDEIYIFVGDFRFGNKYLKNQNSWRNQHGIDKDLINYENDKKLYDLCIKTCIEIIQECGGDKVKFIFWCLAFRELQNIESNKYMQNLNYSHPIWNLKNIEEKFKDNIIPLHGNVNKSFVIDSSSHPSILGYSYLHKTIVQNKPHTTKNNIPIEKLIDVTKYDVIGDSILIDEINNQINRGVILSKEKLKKVKISELSSYAKKSMKDIIYISNIRSINGNDIPLLNRIDRLHNIKKNNKNIVNIVLWEAFAQEIISVRQKNYSIYKPKRRMFEVDMIAKSLTSKSNHYTLDSKNVQSFVELNVNLQPSISGIIWALNSHILAPNDLISTTKKIISGMFNYENNI